MIDNIYCFASLCVTVADNDIFESSAELPVLPTYMSIRFDSLLSRWLSDTFYIPLIIISLLSYLFLRKKQNKNHAHHAHSVSHMIDVTSLHYVNLDVASVFEKAMDISLQVTKAVMVCIVYFEENEEVIVVTSTGNTRNRYENINTQGGIVEEVIQSSKTIASKKYEVEGFEKFISMKSGAMICVPILKGSKAEGCILYRMPTYSRLDNSLNEICQCIAANTAIMLDKISVANEYKRQQAISSVYLALAKTCSADFSFEMVLDVIIQSVYKLVEAEYVSIFLCDHHRRELTLIASKDGFQGLTIDFGQGIAGYVASTAKAVCIADAYTDTRFDQKMDKVAQHRTKSMLCVPILGFGSTQDVAIAVIQAMNKEGKPHFVPQDESVLVNVAAEISKTFKTRIVDVKYLSSSAAREDDLYLEEGLYKEYGSTIQKRFRIGEDLQLESLNHDAFSSLVKDEGPDNLPATPKAHRSKTFYNDALRVNTWDIDPFLLEEDEMIRLLLHMLYSFGVDDILKISKDRLVAFLGAVKGKYRSSNAFHNSRHAFGVMHISFMILSLGAAKYLTPLEAITVLIAAYCHDLDHPGNTNSFEVAVCSPLAVMYSYESVLERHHSHMAHLLLNDPKYDILENLSPGDKADMRQVVTHAILSTDMAKHADEMALLYQCAANNPPFDKTQQSSRYTLIALILHSADIGAQTQELSIALKWGERLREEFTEQVSREVALGVQPTGYMMGLQSDLKYYQLQSGFVAGFVLPLWQVFASVIPNLDHAVTQCESNLAHYKERVHQLQMVDAAPHPELT